MTFSASVPTHLRVLGGERLEQQDGVVVIVHARVNRLAARYCFLLLGGRRSPGAELVRVRCVFYGVITITSMQAILSTRKDA